MAQDTWDAERVRALLPDVPVLNGGRCELWRCTGRRCDFARLWSPENYRLSVEVSWDTIVRVLNAAEAVLI